MERRWLSAVITFLALALLPRAAQCRDTLVLKSEQTRPDWLTKSPDTKGGLLFFVGRHSQAPSIAVGGDAAIKDAAAQIAGYINTRVSQKFISRNEQAETKIVDEIRAAAKGNLTGVRVQSLYWEQYRSGGWFGKRGYFQVWVLIAYPETGIVRERQRLKSMEGVFRDRLSDLCGSFASWMTENSVQGQGLRVSGFKEQVSNKRYAFSRIVEADLSDCLVGAGVKVTQGKNQKLVLTGSYYKVADAVMLSVRLIRMADGNNLHAAAATIPEDSIDPLWLQIEEAKEDDYSASLEQWQSKQHHAVGALSLDSEPRGASAYVDGELRAKTYADVFDIPVGVHSIVFDLKGYELLAETVRVAPGEKVVLKPQLVPKTGTLRLASVPAKAQVYLNNKLRGQTPMSLTLPIGAYEAVLRKENYKEAKLQVGIKHKETTEQTVTLTEADGSLVVVSDPPKAEVYIDGNSELRGKTPLRLSPFPAGSHRVVVTKAGFSQWIGEVTVHANEPATVTATLREVVTGRIVVRGTPTNSKLYINGASKLDLNGMSVYELPVGKHRLKLTLAGYEPWEKTVTVTKGSDDSFNPKLKRLVYSAEGRERTIDWRGEHTSRKALVRGLLFPGWGQYYADPGSDRWLRTLIGVGGLTGLGFYFDQNRVSGNCEQRTTQGPFGPTTACIQTERRQTTEAIITWSAALVIHLWGAYDGTRVPIVSDWSLVPKDKGVQVAWTRRF